MRYTGYIWGEDNKILEKVYGSTEKECEDRCKYLLSTKYKDIPADFQVEDFVEEYGEW